LERYIDRLFSLRVKIPIPRSDPHTSLNLNPKSESQSKQRSKPGSQQQCGTWAVRWWAGRGWGRGWSWAVRSTRSREWAVRAISGRAAAETFHLTCKCCWSSCCFVYLPDTHTHTNAHPPDTDTCPFQHQQLQLNWVCFVCDLKLSKLINEACNEERIVLGCIIDFIFW